MAQLSLSPIQFRPAEPGEITLLNDIAFCSKAYWAYAPAQMEAWRAELAISPAWISMQRVHVALAGEDIAGFFVILDHSGQWQLEHLWVKPAAIGQGTGRALLDEACRIARSLGARALIVHADPHAAGFYQACGAELTGALAAPLENAASRTLPVFRLRGAVSPSQHPSEKSCLLPSSPTCDPSTTSTR